MGACTAEKLFHLNPDVVVAHGGKKVGGGEWVMRCPVHDDSTPSLSLRERDGQVLFHCHAGCSGRDVGRALIDLGVMSADGSPANSMSSQEYEEWRKRRERALQRSKAEERRLRRKRERVAWGMWSGGLPLSRARQEVPEAYALAMCYFEARGIPESAVLRFGRSSLRIHPFMRTTMKIRDEHGKRRAPTVVSAVRRGKWVAGVHRTFLDEGVSPSGKALERAAYGTIKGCAIQLGQLSRNLRRGILGVAEGLETAMTLGLAFPEVPFWSTISAGGLAEFVVPRWVKRLIVAVDLDQPKNGQRLGAGPKASEELRARLRKERPDVEVREVYPVFPAHMKKIPSGYDWNDTLREMGLEETTMGLRRQLVDWLIL